MSMDTNCTHYTFCILYTICIQTQIVYNIQNVHIMYQNIHFAYCLQFVHIHKLYIVYKMYSQQFVYNLQNVYTRILSIHFVSYKQNVLYTNCLLYTICAIH